MNASTEELIRINVEGAVGVIALNRPQVFNALSRSLMEGLEVALKNFEKDAAIRAVVIAGNERAFAAGADIVELQNAKNPKESLEGYLSIWDRVGRFPKPLIAAVSGFALGGGFELALACDMIVASETAVFGQPEIDIGVIPGAGGTQRLTKIVGKNIAMEVVIAGRKLSAREALALGLVNRVVPVESFLDEAKKLAAKIAEKPPIAAKKAKEAIRKAVDSDVETGLRFERDRFYELFETEDQKEGMKAFLEKRRPAFKGK